MEVRLPHAHEPDLTLNETAALLRTLGLGGSHLEWRERMASEHGPVPSAHQGYEVRVCRSCGHPFIIGRNQGEWSCGVHQEGR